MNILDAIESDTVKQWIKDNNYKFSEADKISLIYNSNLKIEEKDRMLTELLDEIDDKSEISNELKNIIKYIRILKIELNNNDTAISFELIIDKDDLTETRCVSDMDTLRKVVNQLKQEDKKIENQIRLINLETSDVMAYININDNIDIIEINWTDKSNYNKRSKYMDWYVDIPMKFSIGDKIKIHGEQEAWVVCYDNEIPEQLKDKCDFFDSCVTAVPESVLDSSRDYKEQIEEIIKNRIPDVQYYKEEVPLDIIEEHHTHISITLVERI